MNAASTSSLGVCRALACYSYTWAFRYGRSQSPWSSLPSAPKTWSIQSCGPMPSTGDKWEAWLLLVIEGTIPNLEEVWCVRASTKNREICHSFIIKVWKNYDFLVQNLLFQSVSIEIWKWGNNFSSVIGQDLVILFNPSVIKRESRDWIHPSPLRPGIQADLMTSVFQHLLISETVWWKVECCSTAINCPSPKYWGVGWRLRHLSCVPGPCS